MRFALALGCLLRVSCADGTGGDYWLSGPPARAMMDTPASRGIGDSLPLTSLALDTALLQFGLFESALSKIGFYFSHFIHTNGTIDMGHWKDLWGMQTFNCTFPDGLTDHGRPSRRRDCYSAAPPSPCSRCFNRHGEGASAK